MENESIQPASLSPLWKPVQVIVMSAVCLVIGVVLGYLLRGSAPVAPPAPAGMTAAAAPASPMAASPASTTNAPASAGTPEGHPKLSLDDMKRMADAKAAPLLAKLKTNPKDAATLNQLGILYRATHQFKEAEGYFEKSLEIDPKNVDVRTDLASCLYYTGDADGALAQLNKALTYDPKHAGALMNLGLIKWKAKNDVPGAVAAWQKLLKLNPDFAQKDTVQRMINDAEQSSKTQG
jgi:cytochrome c-type biogenesis protein CcmH/NrfG